LRCVDITLPPSTITIEYILNNHLEDHDPRVTDEWMEGEWETESMEDSKK